MMTDTSIKATTTDTDNAPVRARVNDRGEAEFEGLREYQCLSEVCRECGDMVELAWDEVFTHHNWSADGRGWSVAVEFWPEQQAWRVYAELLDSASTLGSFIEREVTDAFHDALTFAYDRADMLNKADQPEHPDIAFLIECSDIVTSHYRSSGRQFGEALSWLVKHPHLQKVPTMDLVTALNDAQREGRFGAVTR